MKKCPFCAEEIQDAAIVCRFCGRELTAPAPTPSKGAKRTARTPRGPILVGLGLAALIVWVLFGLTQPTRGPGASNQVLQISGAKGSLGVTVTNRESETISDCRLTVLERGRSDRWTASVDTLRPMESASVSWTDFRGPSGSPMPAYIGHSAKYATFACDSHRATRQGAGLQF